MKKSKIFMIAGGFALAISAVFATKASKKFATVVNTVYYYVSGTGFEIAFSGGLGGGAIVTANNASNGVAKIKGVSSAATTLYYKSGTGYYTAYNALF